MIKYYYPKTLKSVIIALSDLFNDIVVYKYTAEGTSAQEIAVPFSFGPLGKDYMGRTENYEMISSATDTSGYAQVEHYGKRYYIQTPRMALTLDGIAYDANRAYGANEWREWFVETLAISGSQSEQIVRDYSPSPYSFNFTLYIMTDSMDYFAQIIENILPYFNPKLFLRVKEFSFLNIERDLPVSLNGVDPEFISPEISDDERRYINATINMTVEGFMYRPFEYSKIIKVINSKYFVIDYSNPVIAAATSGTNFDFSAVNGFIVSADFYSTSAVKMEDDGTYPLSAIPTDYSFSGTYQDTEKDFVYFTSADLIEGG